MAKRESDRSAARTSSCAVTQIAGAYTLARWTARSANGTVEYPFGERPTGNLVYTPGGRVAVMLAAGDRPNLSTDDIVGEGVDERAAAFSSFMAYCGEYAIEGDVVVHRITMSMFPNWVGVEQIRHFELSDDELVLQSPPFEIDGEMVVNELRWARLELTASHPMSKATP